MFTDLNEAEYMERQAPAGGVEVRCYVAKTPIKAELQQVYDQVALSGVDVRGVYLGSDLNGQYVGVMYNKPAATAGIAALPIAVIPLIAFMGILVMVGFGIFKIDVITSNLVKILLVIFGGTIVIVALSRGAITEVAKGYARR